MSFRSIIGIIILGLVLAAAGVVIGLGAAWGLTRFLQSVLFETSPHDPMVALRAE